MRRGHIKGGRFGKNIKGFGKRNKVARKRSRKAR